MNAWSRLSQSFWFIPALMCVGAVALAEGLIAAGHHLGEANLGALDVVITRVGESGSRDLLGAIAGSMLTVASTTFSITIAVLALSSSTYGPRLVRNFMADRGNQFVLGTFVATFLYSLLVLRSIRAIGTDEGDYFVPHVAVNVAVLLAVLSIGVLVYFIHHITDSVQVSTLAEQVLTDLVDVVDRLCPEPTGRHHATAAAVPGPAAAEPGPRDDEGAVLTSDDTGYVQGIDLEGVLSLAGRDDLLVSMRVRPGTHVTTGTVLAVLWPPDRVGGDARASVHGAVRLGQARTPDQDVEFPALLLEEMAVRALSPGTNDPYTAINALDSLASGLVLLARRGDPPSHRRDEDGRLRIIAQTATLTEILEHLVDAMRFYAVGHPTVLHRALDLVAQVGTACPDVGTRQGMRRHPGHLVDAFAATAPQHHDLEALAEHAARVDDLLLSPHRDA